VQDAGSDIVGVDLVAGQEQLLGSCLDRAPTVAKEGIEGREHVVALGMRPAARAVGNAQLRQVRRRQS
jgi:hypothetical protein